MMNSTILRLYNFPLVIILSLFSTHSFAQYLVSDGDTTTTCSGTFFDSGNNSANYQNDEDYVKTICNSDPTGCINIDFTAFDVESGYDFLYIHDGPSVADPLLYTLSGSNLPVGISSVNSNCLTFRFTSDFTVNKTGWEATIACNACPTCSDGIQNGGETGIDCGGTCPPCLGAVCANPEVVPGLPYTFTGTTQGSGDDYSQASVCNSNYMDGEDFVFEYSPVADTCVNIALSGTQSYTGLFFLDGCPDNVASNCIGMNGSSAGNPSLNELHVFSGTTYYIIVSTWPTPDYTPFSINITGITCPTCNDGIANGDETGVDCGGSFCPPCPGSTCNDPNVITALPFNQTGLTTNGAGNEFDGTDACLSQYMTGEDYVFTYTPPVDTCVTFNLTGGTWDIGMFLLNNCPDAGGAQCLQSATGDNSLTINDYLVTGGNTYFLIVASDGNWTPNTNFNISVTEQACATCYDGIQNGDEQWIDCGGSFCPPCTAGPQDCEGSIPLCMNLYYEVNAYSGTGIVPNEINTSSSCLMSGEKNDVWYNFTTQAAGNLCFSITPNNMSDDYDWAVYNLSNAVCTDIYNDPSLEISCNYSAASGITGPNGLTGSQNNPCLTVNAGEYFVVNVSQFTTSTAGYTIDFGASTIPLYDSTAPFFESAMVDCDGLFITLNISENINCDSVYSYENFFVIVNDLGDTITYPSVDSISSNCNSGNNNSDTYFLHLSDILPDGNYTISFSSDPSVFQDGCQNEMTQNGANTSFSYSYLELSVPGVKYCLPSGTTTMPFVLHVSGGVEPVLITQNNSPIYDTIIDSLPVPGSYTFKVTDFNGCTRTSPVVQCSAVDSIVNNYDTLICADWGTFFYPLSFQVIGNNSTQYFLNNIPVDTASWDSLIIPWTYQFSAINSLNCTITTPPITIVIQDSLIYSNDTTIWLDSDVNLFAISPQADQFLWTPNLAIYCDTCNYTVAHPLNTIVYTINVTDTNGCFQKGNVEIVVKTPPYFIPNGFSPNGDSYNDIFMIRAVGLEEIQLRVFDSWGTPLFETKDLSGGWDGTYHGKQMNTGVYTYDAWIKFKDGVEFKTKGNVTLFR